MKIYQNGVPIATPVFDGAKVEDVTNMLKFAELPKVDKLNFMMVEQEKNLIEI